MNRNITANVIEITDGFKIDGMRFNHNAHEFNDFLTNCVAFMDVSREGFDLMIGTIVDSVVDNEVKGVTLEQMRSQLKFLREVNLYLKSTFNPIGD